MRMLVCIVLTSLILLTFTSCADDGEGSFNSDFPLGLYSGENTEDLGFDQFLIIRSSGNAYEAYIGLASLIEPDDWEFAINGEEIDIFWYEDNYLEGWWYADIYSDDLEDIDFSPGENIDYYLEVNNNSYQGEFEMLEELIVNWPEFDFNEDFEFDWDIDEDPQIYHIEFYGYFYDGKEEDEFYENWQISGYQDEFSISKNLYDEYEDCEHWSFGITNHAINYVNHGKCLAWTETYDHHFIHNFGKGTQKQINPKERIKRTIEMFKQKFNK